MVRRLHVVVVGGGPGGLEAARLACAQGHRVTLLERGPRLGGGLLLGSVVHPENAPFLGWLAHEVGRGGVEVELGVEAGPDDVAALGPDAVVVSTGGRVVLPDLPGADLPHVHAARAVIADPAPTLGRRVVIVGGDLVAIEVAEHLAVRRHLVAVLTPGDDIAPEVGSKRRTEHMHRLDRLGVTVHTEVMVERITPGGIVFTPAGGAVREVPAHNVALAGTLEPDLALRDAIAARLPGVGVHAVGDCTGLGLIRGAVADALRVVHALKAP